MGRQINVHIGEHTLGSREGSVHEGLSSDAFTTGDKHHFIVFPGDGTNSGTDANAIGTHFEHWMGEVNSVQDYDIYSCYWPLEFTADMPKARADLLESVGQGRRQTKYTSVYEDFFDKHFRNVLYSESGKLRPISEIKKNLRNITLVGWCHGSTVTYELENYFSKHLESAGVSKEMRHEVLGNLSVLNFNPREPIRCSDAKVLEVLPLSDPNLERTYSDNCPYNRCRLAQAGNQVYSQQTSDLLDSLPSGEYKVAGETIEPTVVRMKDRTLLMPVSLVEDGKMTAGPIANTEHQGISALLNTKTHDGQRARDVVLDFLDRTVDPSKPLDVDLDYLDSMWTIRDGELTLSDRATRAVEEYNRWKEVIDFPSVAEGSETLDIEMDKVERKTNNSASNSHKTYATSGASLTEGGRQKIAQFLEKTRAEYDQLCDNLSKKYGKDAWIWDMPDTDPEVMRARDLSGQIVTLDDILSDGRLKKDTRGIIGVYSELKKFFSENREGMFVAEDAAHITTRPQTHSDATVPNKAHRTETESTRVPSTKKPEIQTPPPSRGMEPVANPKAAAKEALKAAKSFAARAVIIAGIGGLASELDDVPTAEGAGRVLNYHENETAMRKAQAFLGLSAVGVGVAGIGISAGARMGGKIAKVSSSVAKALPFVGTGIGLAWAYTRYQDGDWTGAGLEVAGAAVDYIPIVGQYLSLTIDATLAYRDATTKDGVYEFEAVNGQGHPIMLLDEHGQPTPAIGATISFKKGKKEGSAVWTGFEANGVPYIAVQGQYKNDQKDGKWTQFDSSGRAIGITEYRDGRVLNSRTYYKSGRLRMEFDAATGAFREYYPDGRPVRTGQIKDGKPVGEWYQYDMDGCVSHMCDFNAGEYAIFGKSAEGDKRVVSEQGKIGQRTLVDLGFVSPSLVDEGKKDRSAGLRSNDDPVIKNQNSKPETFVYDGKGASGWLDYTNRPKDVWVCCDAKGNVLYTDDYKKSMYIVRTGYEQNREIYRAERDANGNVYDFLGDAYAYFHHPDPKQMKFERDENGNITSFTNKETGIKVTYWPGTKNVQTITRRDAKGRPTGIWLRFDEKGRRTAMANWDVPAIIYDGGRFGCYTEYDEDGYARIYDMDEPTVDIQERWNWPNIQRQNGRISMFGVPSAEVISRIETGTKWKDDPERRHEEELLERWNEELWDKIPKPKPKRRALDPLSTRRVSLSMKESNLNPSTSQITEEAHGRSSMAKTKSKNYYGHRKGGVDDVIAEIDQRSRGQTQMVTSTKQHS